jgi:hypothetical protein
MRPTNLGRPIRANAPKPRRHPNDAGLLFCCMDVLQIDDDKLARDEPLLYRELQGVCSLCPNKRECALDLSGGFDAMRLDEWWLYCPNSAILTTIGALQKCGRAANRAQLAKLSHLRSH